MQSNKWWINKDVLLISFSAFFADMGYQAILAAFPVFLVIVLKAPIYMLGFAYALTYGVGAVFGYIGGILGDKVGRKRVSIAGNIFILLLSGLGFAANAIQALLLYASGWWSRDFRTPPRRAMLSEATTKRQRQHAFGLLHVLDIGGGSIAIAYLLLLLYLKISIRHIFLFTALPLIISTSLLLFVRVGKTFKELRLKEGRSISLKTASNRRILKGVLLATALFGFSFYSLGFPIITIAQESHNNMLGILSYAVFLVFSAAAGYLIGTRARKMNMIKGLSTFGYALAALASLLLGVFYSMHLNVAFSYSAVALLGIATGSIETFEPTIISFISPKRGVSKGMGYLTASRSVGLFIANAWMGILYTLSPAFSYYYAFAVSLSASVILLYMGRGFRK